MLKRMSPFLRRDSCPAGARAGSGVIGSSHPAAGTGSRWPPACPGVVVSPGTGRSRGTKVLLLGHHCPRRPPAAVPSWHLLQLMVCCGSHSELLPRHSLSRQELNPRGLNPSPAIFSPLPFGSCPVGSPRGSCAVSTARPAPCPTEGASAGSSSTVQTLCQGLSCDAASTVGAWICSCCGTAKAACSSLETSWP